MIEKANISLLPLSLFITTTNLPDCPDLKSFYLCKTSICEFPNDIGDIIMEPKLVERDLLGNIEKPKLSIFGKVPGKQSLFFKLTTLNPLVS